MNIFQKYCEVNITGESPGFFFGIGCSHKGNSSSWIGNLYVKAESAESAENKFQKYIRKNAIRVVDCDRSIEISDIDHPLDLRAINSRGDELSLSLGIVIQGWGV